MSCNALNSVLNSTRVFQCLLMILKYAFMGVVFVYGVLVYIFGIFYFSAIKMFMMNFAWDSLDYYDNGVPLAYYISLFMADVVNCSGYLGFVLYYWFMYCVFVKEIVPLVFKLIATVFIVGLLLFHVLYLNDVIPDNIRGKIFMYPRLF